MEKFGGLGLVSGSHRLVTIDLDKLPPTARFYWTSLACLEVMNEDSTKRQSQSVKQHSNVLELIRKKNPQDSPLSSDSSSASTSDSTSTSNSNSNNNNNSIRPSDEIAAKTQQQIEDEKRYQQQLQVSQLQTQQSMQQKEQQYQHIFQQHHNSHHQQQPSPSGEVNKEMSGVLKECIDTQDKYHVRVGFSWGNLPVEMQTDWSRKNCDKLVTQHNNQHPDLLIGPSEEDAHHQEANLHKQAIIENIGKQVKDPAQSTEKIEKAEKMAENEHKKRHEHKLPKKLQKHAEWCFETLEKYEVKPMKSWGRLPANMIDDWKQRQCDLVFTNSRMAKREISSCVHYNFSSHYPNSFNPKTGASSTFGGGQSITNSILALVSPSSSSSSSDSDSVTSYPNLNKNLPLIAIMAATTTRRVSNPSTDNMALFNFLLPSLIRTLDCGFRYEYVLGYDKGDPFYDEEAGMASVKKWFYERIEMPMRRNAISITLRTVKVHNTLKKPGPVFIAMARDAYDAGASFFYRVNDDTELIHHWPSAFVKALTHLPGNNGPYGVVGPMCTQGNQRILTHDFVHRLHMEIFEMNYYPAELTDWWMDDWISFVYGKQRTYRAQRHHVIHHTGAHGQRYEVDQSHQLLLGQLVTKGKNQIRKWMLSHNVDENHIRNFDQDDFTVNGFVHIDIPSHIDVV